MSEKLTPQRAYEAAKLLWPDTKFIKRVDSLGFVYVNETDYIAARIERTIDWPEGVTRWPMPETKWRAAKMPDDYGKPARFSNGGATHDGVFCGMLHSGAHRFIDQDGIAWRYCQVIDDSETETRQESKQRDDMSVDPGEGWRLLEVGEITRGGDEFLIDGLWIPRTNFGLMVEKGWVPQRRRIEAES